VGFRVCAANDGSSVARLISRRLKDNTGSV